MESNLVKKWMSNPKFKKIVSSKTRDLLKNVYSPHGKYSNGGIVNLDWESNDWSILNRIQTSYTALSSIFNYMKAVSKGTLDLEKYDFMSDEFLKCLDDIFDLANKKPKIFLALQPGDSKLIDSIVKNISKNTIFGNLAEGVTKRFILKNNPNIEFIETSRADDMLKGIDVSFKYNNKIYTVQVKRTSIQKLKKGIVANLSLPRHYNVDYFGLYTYDTYYFIKYDIHKMKILKNGNLYIPYELIKFEEQLTDYDKEILKGR